VSGGAAGVGAASSSGAAGDGTAGKGGRAGNGGSAGAPDVPGAPGTWAEVESPLGGTGPDSTLVKLRDGTVLMVGFGVQAFRFFPDDNAIRPTAVPLRRHASVAASLLDDGRVLVIGGRNAEGRDGVATCDFYDPVADEWAKAADQPAERAQQSAVTLANGDVLVAGGVGPGIGGVPATDVFRYVGASGTWETLAPLTNATRFPSLFLLDVETVMVLSEIPQVYALANMSVLASPALSELRRYATGVSLGTAGVLAVGGERLDVSDDSERTSDVVDGFVAGGNRFTAQAPLTVPRSYAGAVALADGTVFVSGGTGDGAGFSAERYVPATGSWYPETAPTQPTGYPVLLLDDDSVFFGNGARFHPEAWQ
jgi:hypothetical protein